MIDPERFGITINTPDYKHTADKNTAAIVTGEISGADELTELGITYREVDRLLIAELAREDSKKDLSEFHLIRPKDKRD